MTEQTTEIQNLLTEIKGGWAGVSTLPAEVKTLREGADKLATDLKDVRRQLAGRHSMALPRRRGGVSDDCARHLAATFIAHCERSDKLDALCSAPAQRDAVTAFARDTLNLSTRAALTTSDIPLPTNYSGEIRELISEFGVVRRCMSPLSDRHGDQPARSHGHAAGVRVDRDVGCVQREVADGDVRLAGVAQDRRHRAAAARDRRAEHRGHGAVPGALRGGGVRPGGGQLGFPGGWHGDLRKRGRGRESGPRQQRRRSRWRPRRPSRAMRRWTTSATCGPR